MTENLLVALIKRWQSESPVLFKRLTGIALTLLIPLAITYGLLYFDIWTPAKSKNIQTMLLASGSVMIGVIGTASATTTDPKLMDDKTIGNVVEHVANNDNAN